MLLIKLVFLIWLKFNIALNISILYERALGPGKNKIVFSTK